jgi:HEAT repeat protein
MMLPGQTFAYDDALGAHSKINSIALKNFQTEIMPSDPYLKNAYLDNTLCMGIAWDPTDGDHITPPIIAEQRVKPLKFWVIDGGYSADEPEGTMALCHFYDPTQPAGKRYLTDQQFIVNFVSMFNSLYKNPGIDAVQWAIHGENWGTAFDQQYSWNQGKVYLKNALESPDQGNENYGKAWRSLGETMHLMADMTVPAHVRNDGHAKALNDPDPYETSTTWELVDKNKGFAPASDINYGQNPEKLMIDVANYTNSHFLSKDTIPLPPGISSPWHKYSLPSVEGLTPSPMDYLFQVINGERIRIAKTRSLWSYMFDTGKQLYMIDHNVCDDQREVLIPTAIKADEMLVSDFLPRFMVTAQVNPTTTGNGYTMTGGIKGIDKGEWPQISSVKIRNGARIVVTDAKTGKETRTPVKLIDPSGDFNSLSYDFSANPGDKVRLEYDLGGYVVKSDTVTTPVEDNTPVEDKSCSSESQDYIQGLKDNSSQYIEVRVESAYLLGNLSETCAVEPLIQALKDNDSDVRNSAAEALGMIKDIRAVEPLIQALKDNDSDVRNSAAEALGMIKDIRAVEPLIQALKDENEDVMAAAFTSLEVIGKPAVEPLILALKDENSTVRKYAAEALGMIKDIRAVEPLIQALKDENEDVMLAADAALNFIGKPAVEPLILALKDENSTVRKYAADTLGEILDPRAIDPLTQALKDNDSDVRNSASFALISLSHWSSVTSSTTTA